MNWRKLGAASATIIVGAGGTFAADATINPYEDAGDKYVLEVKSDIPQGERVEISKTEPKVDLVFWNDEERVSIKPLFPQTFGAAREEKIAATRPLLSKQMQFKKGDVTAFVEPKEGSMSEFDIDFTLDAKPDTNVFEYRIEGADQLDFFYQPPLTPEEIEGGAYRPDNVVGSYAVYHKTKANHRVGGTNYGTGKAFHIYRPKAIDANGAEVWAELSYSEGVLAVTVPEKWLETAAYPVVIDPTFGYTSAGGSFLSSNIYNTRAVIWDETSTESGTVESISFYGASFSATIAIKAFLTDASKNIVTDGIAPAVSGVNSTQTWRTAVYSSGPSISPLSYWFGLIGSGNSSQSFSWAYDTGSGRFAYRDTTNSYTTPSDPTDATDLFAVGGHYMSVYATYTASGGGGGAAPDDGVVFFD
jgi:hypothetical protein